MSRDCESASRSNSLASSRLDSNVISQTETNSFIGKGNRTQRVSFSFIRTIVTGNLYEIYESEKPIILDRQPAPRKNAVIERDPDEYRKRTAHRAINTIRRLAGGNFSDTVKFLTLTFNSKNSFDITNIDECNKRFSEFNLRLRKKYKNFKYIAVLELQKRGAIHYHVLNNLRFIEKDYLTKLWGHGFIDIRMIKGSRKVGAYLSKYMTKNSLNKKFKGKRTYFTSKNLIRPRVFYKDIASQIKFKLLQTTTPTFSNSYESMMQGTVDYKEFNLGTSRPLLPSESKEGSL